MTKVFTHRMTIVGNFRIKSYQSINEIHVTIQDGGNKEILKRFKIGEEEEFTVYYDDLVLWARLETTLICNKKSHDHTYYNDKTGTNVGPK